MPSKRDPSKQRRAAQNRAARVALANRKVNASAAAAARDEPSSPSKARSSTTAPAGRSRLADAMRTNDQPGGRAALLAVLLGVGAAVSLLFLKVPVDEEGKALSTKEQDARDKAGKPEITDSFTEVYGPVGIVLGILPAATAGVGLYAVRARKNPRWVTGAMFGMVIASTVSRAPILFFPSLAALAVTYYQVRRSERLAQLADAPAPDDESVEEAVDEELADEHPADEDAEDAADDR